MKILFAGTPDFAVPALRAILDDHEVVGVYTQPDRKSGRGKKITMPPIKMLALERDIPIYQPLTLRDQSDIIKQLKPDVFVVVAFGMLLPQEILDIPPLGCLNIHGSILPKWRGAAPIQRAIEAGDSETGVSIMQMEAGLDTGPVFQVLKTTINNQDTSQTLHDKLAELGAQGICETLEEMDKIQNKQLPRLVPTKQNDQLACYAKKISKQEAQVDWGESAELIQRRIRAFNPWPVCQTQHAETRIRLWRSTIAAVPPNSSNLKVGQVLNIDTDGITIACGSESTIGLDALKLEVLQRDGSKALTCKEFLNGYPIQVGDILS